jgi:rod shape determining protein RodA
VGTSFLLFVFSLVLLSGVWIAYRASDLEGQLLAIGITTLIFAHVYINIAMSLGLVPITGLPLPFISSGRTFLIVMMASFGFLQSVSVNRVRNGI